MELIFFTMTIACTIVAALSLFVGELNGMRLESWFAFMDALIALLIMFTFCYLSECITSNLLEIGDVFYNSEWQLLPVNKQRLLIPPIEKGQRIFRLKGLGFFDCSLAAFSSVRNFWFRGFVIKFIFFLFSNSPLDEYSY